MKKLFFLIYILSSGAAGWSQTIVSVSPDSAATGSIGLSVSITGSNTSFNQASSTFLYFYNPGRDLYAYNVNVTDNEHLTADIDIPYNGPTGWYDLYVYDGNGYITLPSAFMVTQGPTPTISYATDTVCNGQDLGVIITGQNTLFTQASSTSFVLEFDGAYQQPSSYYLNVINDTNAIAYFNLYYDTPGAYNITYFDNFGEAFSGSNTIFIHPPVLRRVIANQSERNITLDVLITGDCTNFQSASNTSVSFQRGATQLYANYVNVSDNNNVIANITLPDSTSLGYYNVNVQDFIDNQITLPDGFLITDTGAGCSAHFTMYPDTTTPHHYYALNQATGTGPLTYTWTWGDGSSPSTGPTPSHLYSDSGYYDVCLTITDTTGCTSTYCDSSTYFRSGGNLMISVTVVTQLTGITQLNNDAAILIYPNPATSQIMVQTVNFQPQQICIYDMNGRKISDKKYTPLIDIGALEPGLYFIELKDGNIMGRKKFVKL